LGLAAGITLGAFLAALLSRLWGQETGFLAAAGAGTLVSFAAWLYDRKLDRKEGSGDA